MVVNEVLTPIRKFCASYLEELGGNESLQNSYLISYLSIGLKKLAHVAYVVRYSDPLNVMADGNQTFQVNGNGSAITDLYAPLRLIGSNGMELEKRTTYAASKGWYREAANMPVHTKGISGVVILQYVAYPKTVALVTDEVEFPESALLGLAYHVSAMVMESLPNAKDLAVHYYTLSAQHLKIAVLANRDSRGLGSWGYVPTVSVVDEFYKG